MVTVEMPMVLKNSLNTREHWGDKAKRARVQRDAVGWLLRASRVEDKLMAFEMAGGLAQPKRRVVTLTRVFAGRMQPMDDDGLPAAFKHVRDGIADYFGVNDSDPRIEWRYAQLRGKPASVRVGFEVVAQAVAS